MSCSPVLSKKQVSKARAGMTTEKADVGNKVEEADSTKTIMKFAPTVKTSYTEDNRQKYWRLGGMMNCAPDDGPNHKAKSSSSLNPREVQTKATELSLPSNVWVNRKPANLPALGGGENNEKSRGHTTRRDSIEPFGGKLFRIMEETEQRGESDIIGFLPHGKSFAVFDIDRFTKELLPRYFPGTKFSSFRRQLNYYGFRRVSEPNGSFSYFHPHFQKNKKTDAMMISRVNRKKAHTANKDIDKIGHCLDDQHPKVAEQRDRHKGKALQAGTTTMERTNLADLLLRSDVAPQQLPTLSDPFYTIRALRHSPPAPASVASAVASMRILRSLQLASARRAAIYALLQPTHPIGIGAALATQLASGDLPCVPPLPEARSFNRDRSMLATPAYLEPVSASLHFQPPAGDP